MNIKVENEHSIKKTAHEEILKWRQCSLNNHGEKNSPFFLSQQQGETLSELSSFVFSRTTATTAARNIKNSRHLAEFKMQNNEESKKISSKLYITLAKEDSPNPSDENDSDTTASYGSYHDKDTEVCMDSSDTESNSSNFTTIEGTVQVVEYDVASASESDVLYSNDSSSGTDENLFVMATALIESTNMITTNISKIGDVFSWSSDFADTEESENSDNCFDSELSPADYWVCVKCKNLQNNPMFRYCEKCYQIRKTHFPPRPQLRRKNRRLNKKRKLKLRNADLSPSDCQSDDASLSTTFKIQQKPNKLASTSDGTPIKNFGNNINFVNANSKLNGNKLQTNPYKKRKLSYNNNKNHSSQLNSAAESSTSEDDDNVNDIDLFLVNRNESPGSSIGGSSKFSAFSGTNGNNYLNCHEDIFDENDFINDYLLKTQHLYDKDKDSGIGSAPSSQDIPLSKSSDENLSRKVLGKKFNEKKLLKRKFENVNNDDNSSDTLLESDHNDSSIKSNTLNPNKSTTINNIFHNLDKNLSAFPSVANELKCNALSQVVPRSVSCFENQIINSPKSPSISTTTNLQSKINFDFPIDNSCIICLTAPKNGAFVHSRFLHLCCCYKCAIKVWNKTKKCPICNCAVKNVMKLFVH